MVDLVLSFWEKYRKTAHCVYIVEINPLLLSHVLLFGGKVWKK